MKNKRINRTVFLAAAGAILTASLSVGSALAYFTAYCTASGAVPVEMGFTETEIEETVKDDGKHIRILNTGVYSCFVRVRVFAPAEILETISFREPGNEGNWKACEDGCWCYVPVLEADKRTTELLVGYEFPEDKSPEEFNIVVVCEYSPVFYDENGNPKPDWEFTVSSAEGDSAKQEEDKG